MTSTLPLRLFSLLLAVNALAQYGGPDGNRTGPVTNTVPCRHFTGVWQDSVGTQNTYSITTDLNTNQLSGTASIAHPGGGGCPRVGYTLSGFITPVGSFTVGVRGTTRYEINLTNPTVGVCNGINTGGVALSGDIRNDGCDVAFGPWANTQGPGSGTLSLVKVPDLPLGETTSAVGWWSAEPTIMQWRSTLVPPVTIRPLDGRQVLEQAGSARGDGCWFPDAASAGLREFQVTGAWWVVGRYATPPAYPLSNTWIDDYVGYSTFAVGYYRLNARAPCDGFAQQLMRVCTNGNGCAFSQQYKSGWIGAGIETMQVYSSRDLQDVYRAYP